MNLTEAWLFNEKVKEVREGKYLRVAFEAITFRLADKTSYTPDLYLLGNDGMVEFIECKGSWRARGQDAARVKLKVAAAMYPEFKFTAYLIKNYKIVKIEEF